MILLAHHKSNWNHRQWALVFLAIFTAQACLVFWLSGYQAPTTRPPQPVISVDLAPRSPRDQVVPWSDPTLQAMAHHAGFSGPIWTNTPPLDHGLFQWTEPPRWLALDAQSLGTIHPSPDSPPNILSFSAPGLPKPIIERLTVPELPIQETTWVEFDDPWLKDRLPHSSTLPMLHHTNVLKPTGIELAVMPIGQVHSARITDSSGWDHADASGLLWAQKLALLPEANAATHLLPSPFTAAIGRIHIHWHTSPPESAVQAPRPQDPSPPTP